MPFLMQIEKPQKYPCLFSNIKSLLYEGLLVFYTALYASVQPLLFIIKRA